MVLDPSNQFPGADPPDRCGASVHQDDLTTFRPWRKRAAPAGMATRM